METTIELRLDATSICCATTPPVIAEGSLAHEVWLPKCLKIASANGPITSGRPLADRQAAKRSSGIARARWLLPVTASQGPRCNGASQSGQNRPSRRASAPTRHPDPRRRGIGSSRLIPNVWPKQDACHVMKQHVTIRTGCCNKTPPTLVLHNVGGHRVCRIRRSGRFG